MHCSLLRQRSPPKVKQRTPFCTFLPQLTHTGAWCPRERPQSTLARCSFLGALETNTSPGLAGTTLMGPWDPRAVNWKEKSKMESGAWPVGESFFGAPAESQAPWPPWHMFSYLHVYIYTSYTHVFKCVCTCIVDTCSPTYTNVNIYSTKQRHGKPYTTI